MAGADTLSALGPSAGLAIPFFRGRSGSATINGLQTPTGRELCLGYGLPEFQSGFD